MGKEKLLKIFENEHGYYIIKSEKVKAGLSEQLGYKGKDCYSSPSKYQ